MSSRPHRTPEAWRPRGPRRGQQVKKAQDAWNTRDPEKVVLAYAEDSEWHNRDEFFKDYEEKEISCETSGRFSVRGFAFAYAARSQRRPVPGAVGRRQGVTS